jgi:hypothetical protein
VSHEPRIKQLSDDFERLGLNHFPVPLGIMLDEKNPAPAGASAAGRVTGTPAWSRPNPTLDWLYVVVNGEVEIAQRAGEGEMVLRRLGAGDCFGEIALVREGPRTATARCLSRVDILAVDREAFHALFANLPPLRGFFQQLITERLGADVPEGSGPS